MIRATAGLRFTAFEPRELQVVMQVTVVLGLGVLHARVAQGSYVPRRRNSVCRFPPVEVRA